MILGYGIYLRAGYVAHYHNKKVEMNVAENMYFNKVKIIVNQMFIHPFINTQKYQMWNSHICIQGQ